MKFSHHCKFSLILGSHCNCCQNFVKTCCCKAEVGCAYFFSQKNIFHIRKKRHRLVPSARRGHWWHIVLLPESSFQAKWCFIPEKSGFLFDFLWMSKSGSTKLEIGPFYWYRLLQNFDYNICEYDGNVVQWHDNKRKIYTSPLLKHKINTKYTKAKVMTEDLVTIPLGS